MRRFPDFYRLVTRVFLTLSLIILGAGVMWLARFGGDTLVATAPESTAAPGTVARAAHDVVRLGAGQIAVEDLVAAGQQLWQDYIPAEIRERYEMPSIEELRSFLARLEGELEDGSTERLAAYERDARRALKLLRRREGGDLLAAWLEPRLDLIRAASQITATPTAPWPEVTPESTSRAPTPSVVAPTPLLPVASPARPQYTRAYWDRVLARRQAPRRATAMMPRLKEIFVAAGVPPELVWIAEVESSMNPEATSPVGARGLFQFMPLTAARFGLETGVMVDERTDPEKSARAAAEYLRVLHRRFRSWPLALAAYNAGEGRVGRALRSEGATTFEGVAHRLPVETRMYVPKVLATVAAREAVDPDTLPAPGVRAEARGQVASDAEDATEPAIATSVGTIVPTGPAEATSRW